MCPSQGALEGDRLPLTQLPSSGKREINDTFRVSCDMCSHFLGHSARSVSWPGDDCNSGSVCIWARVELVSKKQNIPHKGLEKIPSSTGSFFVFLFWNTVDACGSGKKMNAVHRNVYSFRVFLSFCSSGFAMEFS